VNSRPILRGNRAHGRSGVIVTAPGDGNYDFVSRYFAPAKGDSEDSVTDGAHCALAPYWANGLNRRRFAHFKRRGAAGK